MTERKNDIKLLSHWNILICVLILTQITQETKLRVARTESH